VVSDFNRSEEVHLAARLMIFLLESRTMLGPERTGAQSAGVLHSGINEIPNPLAGCSDRDAGGSRGRCSDYV
jgi:hypothetical protein